MARSRFLFKSEGTVVGLGKHFTHLANNVALTARNAANTADVELIKLSTGDVLTLGTNASITGALTTSGSITSTAGNVNALGGAVQTIVGTFTNGTVTGTAQASGLPGFIFGTTSNHAVYFYTNNTAKMILSAAGLLDFKATMTNSSATVGTTAVSDWIQCSIDGVNGHIPWYAA